MTPRPLPLGGTGGSMVSSTETGKNRGCLHIRGVNETGAGGIGIEGESLAWAEV